MSPPSVKKLALIMFLAGVGLRGLWVGYCPLWQQADEYPHFYYVQHLYQQKSFPVSGTEFPYYESYQPPLYYLTVAGLYSLFPSLDTDRDKMGAETEVDRQSGQFRDSNPMAKLLRWFSVLLWCGTYWTAYLFLSRFFRRKPHMVILPLALLAFIPTLVSNSAAITNDGLAVFMATLFFYLAFVERGDGIRRAILLGAILGGAILSKYNNLALIPLLLVSEFTFNRRNWLKSLAPVLAIAFLMVLPWALLNLKTYGTMLPVNPSFHVNSVAFSAVPSELYHSLRNMFWSFWAAAGRVYEIHFPIWLYVFIFGGISLICVAGMLKGFLSNAGEDEDNDKAEKQVLAIGGIFVLLLLFGSLYHTLWGSLLTSWGKNLYVAILPLSILFSYGWLKVRTSKLWVFSLPVLLFILNLVFWWGYVRPYFYG
ncbi:MAG: glycosyltransferase family 39 protein [candidate division Zixibacteria bacterium]|nr:glycosyltransferase family 39 protein [candidate division Zixibacteria bacterium]